MDKEGNSRFECSELHVHRIPGGPPVTLAGLRSMLVGEFVRQIAAEHIDEEPPPTVAGVYRAAVLAGRPPKRAVEEAFGLPRSTASRLIHQAREAGELGPARGQGRVAP